MSKNAIKLKSYAKINLYLNIGKKFTDGYHSIESIMQTINLFDEIYLEETDNFGIHITSNNLEIPVDKNSIIHRAAKILMENIDKGINIFIDKKIPIASGLGGGSSNIATILIGISKLFGLKLNKHQLINIGSHFGMDIPFFMVRGTVFARGRGEIVLPLKPISPSVPMILINPGIKVSTKWAYHLFDKLVKNNIKEDIDINYFLEKNMAIKLTELSQIIYNSFDSVLSEHFSIIEQIKNKLKKLGSIAVTVTGSGSTVYGIFNREEKINQAYNKIKDEYHFVYKTRTIQAKNIFL
ncbi:MAG TPA: 4-(cytidine 5'-diphospho)-2-C-methyl-D-erythritol kinase [Atribacterota bacterium]|nr:4-(cytidine 5'-diphospho)-2-C-methyl-D-erythritol kinase [Atribacterota bacterium]